MRKMLGMILMLTLLSACGNSAANSGKGEVPELLEVKLTGPEQVEKNESVIVKAAVTYGDTPVDDADDVQFEVWKDGDKDNSKMIQPKKENKGEDTRRQRRDRLYIHSSRHGKRRRQIQRRRGCRLSGSACDKPYT